MTKCIYAIGVACYANSFISVDILKISYIKDHIKEMNCIGMYCLLNLQNLQIYQNSKCPYS